MSTCVPCKADDYGWANVGFHSAEAKTPNIDRLATTEGFELRHLYACELVHNRCMLLFLFLS